MLEYSSNGFMKKIFLFTLLFIAIFKVDYAQNDECDGAAIRTHEAYLYGRFETKMKSTQGSGIVSSFFLYNWDIGCNWPEENNEIDIEMTGNLDASVQFTTHHPYQTSVTEIVPTSFNPHEVMIDYAIEWEPNVVRWFIDGELALEQTHNFITQLEFPMRIFMNLWAVSLPTWTGEWDPSALPGMSKYDYVKYYEYTPGLGDYGTNNNYSLLFQLYCFKDKILDLTNSSSEYHLSFLALFIIFIWFVSEYAKSLMICSLFQILIVACSIMGSSPIPL